MYTQTSVIPVCPLSLSVPTNPLIRPCKDYRLLLLRPLGPYCSRLYRLSPLQFDIRCSDILDFNEGGMRRTKENEQRFYTFLGWILGNPVGNIKEQQYPGSRR